MELISLHIISLFHALFLAQCVGSAATPLATYLLLGIDFMINMYLGARVFYLHKKGRMADCGETLQNLVVNEFLEFKIPLLFLVCFLASFHGQNAEILGITDKSVNYNDYKH